MSSKDKSSDTARQQVLAEHHEIAQIMHHITEGDAAAMIESLHRLEILLQRHFAAEENEIDGVHQDIRDRTPEHDGALQRLKAEHRELLERISAALAYGADADATARLRTACADLRKALRKHEATETGLFLDSIWTDSGVAD